MIRKQHNSVKTKRFLKGRQNETLTYGYHLFSMNKELYLMEKNKNPPKVALSVLFPVWQIFRKSLSGPEAAYVTMQLWPSFPYHIVNPFCQLQFRHI